MGVKNGTSVLICVSDQVIPAVYLFSEGVREGFFYKTDLGNWMKANPSHWMHLPKPKRK